jgi:kynureninase
MSVAASLDKRASELDRADPLSSYRERFHLPEGIIYLDGNSLGPLPKATRDAMHRVIEHEWGDGLIRSWNEAEWFSMGERVGAAIAPLIGAKACEVIACDTVSVNLYKLIAAALDMQRDKGRQVILSEPGNFPTDIYMIEGLERQGLGTRRLSERCEIAGALDEDVALLLLTHAHYRTGELFDMEALTKAAHDAGALVLWDLSHSTGALPVDLEGCGADFATGCGYKYLCGGPGAPAFAFVAERHLSSLRQPLTGWFGHARPFAFADDYEAAPGIAQLQCGTSPILALTALQTGVNLIAEIGVARLHAKSMALSEFFLDCVTVHDLDLDLISPRDSAARGSQLSFRHEHAYALSQALIARGVIGDFRDPDVLRLGFAPAFLRFVDMAQAASHLAQIMQSGEWRAERFAERSRVT